MLKPEMDQYFNMDARAKVLIDWGNGIRIAGFIIGSIELIGGISIAAEMYIGGGVAFLISLLIALLTVAGCALARHLLIAYAAITQNTLDCVDLLKSYKTSIPITSQKKYQPSVQKTEDAKSTVAVNEAITAENVDVLVKEKEFHSNVYFPKSRWLCPSCGNENEPFCNVCSNCGSIIKDAPQSNA